MWPKPDKYRVYIASYQSISALKDAFIKAGVMDTDTMLEFIANPDPSEEEMVKYHDIVFNSDTIAAFTTADPEKAMYSARVKSESDPDVLEGKTKVCIHEWDAEHNMFVHIPNTDVLFSGGFAAFKFTFDTIMNDALLEVMDPLIAIMAGQGYKEKLQEMRNRMLEMAKAYNKVH